MIVPALLSALHVLALALGLGSVVARGRSMEVARVNLPLLVKLNDVEVVLVVLLPFLAALMARGAWLY